MARPSPAAWGGPIDRNAMSARRLLPGLVRRLDDGSWTSIKDKDGQEGLRPVGSVDAWYRMEWPFGGIIRGAPLGLSEG